jgi:hypothetical protein
MFLQLWAVLGHVVLSIQAMAHRLLLAKSGSFRTDYRLICPPFFCLYHLFKDKALSTSFGLIDQLQGRDNMLADGLVGYVLA